MTTKNFLLLFFGVLVVIIIPIVIYNVYINWTPSGPEVGTSIPIQGRLHVPIGTHVKYTTNPPTSGPHYPIPEAWGIKTSPVMDEYAVHSLEHGSVWITYQPDNISSTDLDQLKLIANKYARIILSPRPANDSYISLVSWGRTQKFNKMDSNLINLFAYRNRNHGPERWVMDSPLVVWILHRIPPY